MRTRHLTLATILLGTACGSEPTPEHAIDGPTGHSRQASHSWGSYHWARTANPFTLKLGDGVSSGWDGYLTRASSDWSASSVLDTAIVAGSSGGRRRCKPVAGRTEVCNAAYGNNGWLGAAQIWVSGSHIVQATARLNDTYFSSPAYDTAAWRSLVMCQEIGHTLGLDHQDEDFDNRPLGSCMDYSNDPVPNQHPNRHDHEQLEVIYGHFDSTTTVFVETATATDADEGEHWGRLVGRSPDGRLARYERSLGGDRLLVTLVIWA